MKIFQQNYVKNLPDKYAKTPQSHNYKILEINRLACENLRAGLDAIFNILDMDNATGETLDNYGDRVNQPRGNATDEQYLYMIKTKIARNLTNGSEPAVIDAICMTLKCEPSQVLLIEREEPGVVELVTLPFDVIVKAGFTTNQLVALIESLLPVGVRLVAYNFEGTFTFSDVENEYDAAAGFCDVEGGTLGGYFGVLLGQDEEAILPV